MHHTEIVGSAGGDLQPFPSAGTADADVEDRLADVKARINRLYEIEETFYPVDPGVKAQRLRAESRVILAQLDSIQPGEQRCHPGSRGQLAFLRGNTLNVGAEYSQQAEEQLSKAVKLDPGLVDAWTALGVCFWKKKDLSSARNCFNLALSKGPEKSALRHLSMLDRCLAREEEGGGEARVAASLASARAALSLDVADGQSWYTLGNAYLTLFFAGGAAELAHLRSAIKAYQNAERDKAACANPDLPFNSAHVYRYLEDYQRALAAYAEAGARDPNLGAAVEMEKILRLLAHLEALVAQKGGLPPERFWSLVDSLASSTVPGHFHRADMASLSAGANRHVAVPCRVLAVVPHQNSVPLCYVVADRKGSCFVLSVYALRFGVIRVADLVTLLEPELRQVSVKWEDKVYQYPNVRLDQPTQLLLRGQPLRASDISCSVLKAENHAC